MESHSCGFTSAASAAIPTIRLEGFKYLLKEYINNSEAIIQNLTGCMELKETKQGLFPVFGGSRFVLLLLVDSVLEGRYYKYTRQFKRESSTRPLIIRTGLLRICCYCHLRH
jgi:hypothetical protein